MPVKKVKGGPDPWLQGYACAVAVLKNSFGDSTEVREMMANAALTFESCMAAEVDESDLRSLFPDAHPEADGAIEQEKAFRRGQRVMHDVYDLGTVVRPVRGGLRYLVKFDGYRNEYAVSTGRLEAAQ